MAHSVVDYSKGWDHLDTSSDDEGAGRVPRAGPRVTQLVDGETLRMGNYTIRAEKPETGVPRDTSSEDEAAPPGGGGGELPQEQRAATAEGAEVAGVVERLGGLAVAGGEASTKPGMELDVCLGYEGRGDFGDFAGHVKQGLKPAKAKAGVRELFEGVDRVLGDVAREYSLTRPQLLARCAILEDLLHQVETYFAGNQNSVQEVSITPFGSFASGLSRQVGDVDLSLRGTYK